MALQELTLESLRTIDGGRVAIAFEEALKTVYNDLRDRPALATAREVTLKLKLSPKVDPAGDLDRVFVAFDIQDKLPKRSSVAYAMKATADGLLYEEFSPEDPNQGVFEFEDAAEETDGK